MWEGQLQKFTFLLEKEMHSNDENSKEYLVSCMEKCLFDASLENYRKSENTSKVLSYSLFVLLELLEKGRENRLNIRKKCLTLIKSHILVAFHPSDIINVAPGILSLSSKICSPSISLDENSILLSECINLITQLSLLLIDNLSSYEKDKVEKLSENLPKVICGCRHLQIHSHSSVRRAMSDLSYSLLLSVDDDDRKRSILNPCIEFLLDTLALGIIDDYSDIREYCEFAILCIIKESNGMNMMAKLAFHSVVENINSVLYSLNEKEKHRVLKIASGYLVMQRPILLELSVRSLKRLIGTICEFLTMDFSSVQLVESRSSFNAFNSATIEGLGKNNSLALFHSNRQFMYFQDETIEMEINRLLNMLGEHGDVLLILNDVLIPILESDWKEALGVQVIQVVNEIIRGYLKKDDRLSAKEIVALILPYFLDHPCLKEATSNTERQSVGSFALCSQTQSTVNQISHFNRVVTARVLVLRGLGLLGRIDSGIIKDTLYPILEGVGDFNEHVHDAACLVLSELADFLDLDSCASLIELYANDILNAISTRIRYYLDISPFSLKVLYAVINTMGRSVISLVDDLVEECLLALDCYGNHDYVKASVFWCFREISRVILKGNRNFSESEFKSARKFCESTLKKLDHYLAHKSSTYRASILGICASIIEALHEIDTMGRGFEKKRPENDEPRNDEPENDDEDGAVAESEKTSFECRPIILAWFSRNWEIIYGRLKSDIEDYSVSLSAINLLNVYAKSARDFFPIRLYRRQIVPLYRHWILGFIKSETASNKSSILSSYDKVDGDISPNDAIPKWMIVSSKDNVKSSRTRKEEYSIESPARAQLFEAIFHSLEIFSISLQLKSEDLTEQFMLMDNFICDRLEHISSIYHDKFVTRMRSLVQAWNVINPEFTYFMLSVRIPGAYYRDFKPYTCLFKRKLHSNFQTEFYRQISVSVLDQI